MGSSLSETTLCDNKDHYRHPPPLPRLGRDTVKAQISVWVRLDKRGSQRTKELFWLVEVFILFNENPSDWLTEWQGFLLNGLSNKAYDWLKRSSSSTQSFQLANRLLSQFMAQGFSFDLVNKLACQLKGLLRLAHKTMSSVLIRFLLLVRQPTCAGTTK